MLNRSIKRKCVKGAPDIGAGSGARSTQARQLAIERVCAFSLVFMLLRVVGAERRLPAGELAPEKHRARDDNFLSEHAALALAH